MGYDTDLLEAGVFDVGLPDIAAMVLHCVTVGYQDPRLRITRQIRVHHEDRDVKVSAQINEW